MPVNRRLSRHLFKNIIILIKISHQSLSLHGHSLPFSFSLILTFSFSLSFVSTATTMKATIAVGHGSLLTGFHQLSLKKLRLLSLKTQTSLIKSGLSLSISLDGGYAVLVAWSWHEGCGLGGCGFYGMGFC